MVEPTARAPLPLEASARLLGRYCWVEMRLFEMLGTWVPDVPELDSKLHLATQSRHHGEHAELWHGLVPTFEGEPAERYIEPPSAGFVVFLDAVAEPSGPGTTVEKLVGAHRVLLPHALATYERHLSGASGYADGPTARALQRVVSHERDESAEAESLLRSLLLTAVDVDRAASHQARLENLLLASGGIAVDTGT
jgi:hypothetical protein